MVTANLIVIISGCDFDCDLIVTLIVIENLIVIVIIIWDYFLIINYL